MDIIDRISEVCYDKKIVKSHLIKMKLSTQQTVYAIFKKKQKPGIDFISKFLKLFPDVDGDWLMTGNGDKYKSGNNKITTYGNKNQFKNIAMDGNVVLERLPEYISQKLGECHALLESKKREIEALQETLRAKDKLIELLEKRQ